MGWRLLGFTAAFLVLATVGFLVVPWRGLVGQGLVVLAAALIAGWALLALAEDRGPEALGFYLDRDAIVESVAGLALGVLVALAAVAAMAVAGVAAWTDDAGTIGGFVVEGLTALALLALPAAAEEALFRGYPLQVLARAWGALPALGATSVAFGFLHFANPGLTVVAMINLIAAGALLGVIYLKTASLWWATAAHLGWNWAHGFLTDLPVSGLELVDAPLWDGVTRGSEWLGGGAFGPEGSVLTTAVLAVGTVLLWRGSWLRPGSAARASRPLVPLPEEDVYETHGRHGGKETRWFEERERGRSAGGEREEDR